MKSYAAAATAGLLDPDRAALQRGRLAGLARQADQRRDAVLHRLPDRVLRPQPGGVPIGVAFFIWVGIFSLMVIAQLWAFANDVYTVEQGQRLFAIVAFGAALGAIAGSFATGQLVKTYGPYPFMLGRPRLLGVCMLLTNIDQRAASGARAPSRPRHRRAAAGGGRSRRTPSRAGRVSGRSGFALVFSDRYLLLIGLLMLVYNLVNTNGEYILGKTVVDAVLPRRTARRPPAASTRRR